MLAQNWYETGLPVDERKQRGHFSTPHALVDQILDACGYTLTADLRAVRVLDPACGSGNFLARAALRLCQVLQQQDRTPGEIERRVRRNLWGLDPDPVACCLAEMQVRSAWETICGPRTDAPPLHIHQADSLALAWQPCVDLLLANPPYLASKNTDLSHYLQGNRRGQADSYLLFLELALRAVRPGGWIGLVVPDPVLARANAAPERADLLRACIIQQLWHLSGVFSAEVGAVVIVARKTLPRTAHQIQWTRARWKVGQVLYQPGSARPEQQVKQALLASQPGAELRYLLSGEQGRVSERLRLALNSAPFGQARGRRLVPLEALVDIKRGEEIGRASSLLGPLAELQDGLPVLRGGVDLRPYAQPVAQLGIERSALKKPLARYTQAKLLVVKSTERLQATLDTQGHVVLQTLYLLQLRIQSGRSPGMRLEKQDVKGRKASRGPGGFRPLAGSGVSSEKTVFEEEWGNDPMDTFYFLLALLNSRLLSAYVYHLHTAYKLVQPQIEQAVLARLPVAWGSAQERGEIAARARELVCACSRAGAVVEWDEDVKALYEEQERAVRALYAATTSGLFVDKGVPIDGSESTNTRPGS